MASFVIILLCLGFLLLVYLASNFLFREKLFDDSDLQVVRIEVPHSENAFNLLMDLEPGLYRPKDIGDTFCLLIRQHYPVVEKLELERRNKIDSGALPVGFGYPGPGLGMAGMPTPSSRRRGGYPQPSRRSRRTTLYHTPSFETIYNTVYYEILDHGYFDEQLISQILEKNKAALQCFDHIVSHSSLQVPLITDFNCGTPYLSDINEVSRVVSMRATYLFRTGRELEAFEEVMKIIKFGHMLENCNGTMLHLNFGSRVKLTGLKRLHELLGQSSLEPSVMKQYIDRLSRFHVNVEEMADILRGEYCMAKDEIDGISSDKKQLDEWLYGVGKAIYSVRGRSAFMPEETKRLLGMEARSLIDDLSRPYSRCSFYTASTGGVYRGCTAGILDKMRSYSTKNFIGLQIYGARRHDPHHVIQTKCLEDAVVSITRVLVALRCYRGTYGDLPESLDELVPEFINAVPIDPFDSQPLRYSKEKKRVYSIGRDLIDSGGADPKLRGPSGLPATYWMLQYADEPSFVIDF